MAAGIPLVPTHPADPYAWAVQAAQREYPRLTQYPPMRLTYNPQREGYSETFDPKEGANPYPGNWTVEMGESPYYYTPNSWPGLVGLESLHMMQQLDPRYQQMTAQLQGSLTQPQRDLAQQIYQREQAPVGKGGYDVTEPFQTYLPHVFIPEMIRSVMFRDLFNRMETAEFGGPKSNRNEYNLTPDQTKLIDQIQQYMRSTGR